MRSHPTMSPQQLTLATRQLSIVMALAEAKGRPMSHPQIRRAIGWVRERESIDTLDKRFERDKFDLRQVGVNLIHDMADDGAIGYVLGGIEPTLPEGSEWGRRRNNRGVRERTWENTHIARWLDMLIYASSEGRVCMRDLADRYGVSVDVIRGDLDALMMVGIKPFSPTDYIMAYEDKFGLAVIENLPYWFTHEYAV